MTTRDTRSRPVPTRTGVGTGADVLLAAIASFVIFFPSVITRFTTMAIVSLVLMALILLSLLGRQLVRPNRTAAMWIVLGWLIPSLVGLAFLAGTGNPEHLGAAVRYLLIIPLGVVTGIAIGAGRRAGTYARTFVWVAGAVGALALYERTMSVRVLPDVSPVFAGRAVVGSEHPLVLGVLLCIAVTLVSTNRRSRFFWLPLLVGGAYATDSIGPTILAILFGFVVLVPRPFRWLAGRKFLVGTIVIAALAIGVYLTTSVYSAVLYDATSDEYSAQYRAALFALLPQIIADAPFGYGFGGIPEGRWFLMSQIYGFRDISRTIDSEIVYLSGFFGVLALAMFGYLLAVSVRALRYGLNWGMPLLAVIGCAVFVAMTAWGSVTLLSALIVGATAHYVHSMARKARQ